jgi:hypothetical protein
MSRGRTSTSTLLTHDREPTSPIPARYVPDSVALQMKQKTPSSSVSPESTMVQESIIQSAIPAGRKDNSTRAAAMGRIALPSGRCLSSQRPETVTDSLTAHSVGWTTM